VIILDTDTYTLLQAEKNPNDSILARRVLAAEDVCVTIITFEEQMRGWLAFIAKARDEQRRIFAYGRLTEMLNDFRDIRVIGFEPEASFHFERLRKAKLRIGTMDLKIGAIALAHSATLITRNTDDFERIAGLKFEDWTRD
jgi:tRNA(fMet)-specific endonuclease VapC